MRREFYTQMFEAVPLKDAQRQDAPLKDALKKYAKIIRSNSKAQKKRL